MRSAQRCGRQPADRQPAQCSARQSPRRLRRRARRRATGCSAAVLQTERGGRGRLRHARRHARARARPWPRSGRLASCRRGRRAARGAAAWARCARRARAAPPPGPAPAAPSPPPPTRRCPRPCSRARRRVPTQRRRTRRCRVDTGGCASAAGHGGVGGPPSPAALAPPTFTPADPHFVPRVRRNAASDGRRRSPSPTCTCLARPSCCPGRADAGARAAQPHRLRPALRLGPSASSARSISRAAGRRRHATQPVPRTRPGLPEPGGPSRDALPEVPRSSARGSRATLPSSPTLATVCRRPPSLVSIKGPPS